MNKKIKIIFTLSLVLNLFLLGGIGGYVLRPHDGSHWKEVRKSVSPETREIMKQTFKEKRQDMHEIFTEARQKKKALADIFSAEVFDPVAYDHAAKELLNLGSKISEHKLRTFKELATKLPQSERLSLSKSIVKTLLGRSGHKRGGKRHEQPEKPQNLDKNP